MNIRSITFKPEMIEALLDGCKTQTRRIIKPGKRPFEVGDFLWVRERLEKSDYEQYLLDKLGWSDPREWKWSRDYLLAMHMPKNHSRLTLKVTDVRQQPVQDITETDAQAEGFADIAAFQAYWDGIYKADPQYQWACNPAVTAYTFDVDHRNIHKVELDAFIDEALENFRPKMPRFMTIQGGEVLKLSPESIEIVRKEFGVEA